MSSRLPFAQAAEELAFFWRAQVSDETARRLTEQAGAAYVAVQSAERERIRRERAELSQGPARQQVSLDGALVHAVDGEWVEVKTMAIGTITVGTDPDGQPATQTTDLSYFSRVAEAADFRDAAGVEIARRGTQTAGVVVSVNDGALWIQGVVDHYRRDAVRVLDFAHAIEHLAKAASAIWGRDTPALHAWRVPAGGRGRRTRSSTMVPRRCSWRSMPSPSRPYPTKLPPRRRATRRRATS